MSTKVASFKSFFIIWLGQLISSVGSGVTAFALGVYVFKLTGSAAMYSTLILAAFMPTLLLKPFGGVIADRVNRRIMMVVGDTGSALGILFIILMLAAGYKGLWYLYLGVIISAIFTSIQNPAYKASITDLVDENQYSKASGLMQLAESSKYLLSPAIAGFLIYYLALSDVLLIDFISFIVAVAMVFLVKNSIISNKVEKAATSVKEEFLAGLKYTFRDKGLVKLLLIISLVSFFIGILQALLGPMILSFASAKEFGIAQTVMATGMIVSSILIGIFGKSSKKVPVLCIGLIGVGLFVFLMGIRANIILITISGFLFFMCLPVVNTSLDVLVRRNVENEVQGRVWAIVSLLSQFGMIISLGLAGFLADSVFNPLLEQHGLLASSLGTLVGVGPARGIGVIFMLSGISIIIIGIIIHGAKRIHELDKV